MLIFLVTRGRGFLKAVMLWLTCLLSVLVIAPAAQAATTTDLLGENPTSQSGQNAIVRDATSMANDTFTPWVDEDLPWDANWGAFNTTESERLSSNCGVVGDKADLLSSLPEMMDEEWAAIQDKEKDQKKRPALFAKAFQDRLHGRKAYADDPKDVSSLANVFQGGPGRPTYKDVKDPSDLRYRMSADPAISGCFNDVSALKRIQKQITPSLSGLMHNPATFLVQIVLIVPTTIGILFFSMLSDVALGMALTTPHSERGDTLFNSYSVATSSNTRINADGTTTAKQCKKTGDSYSGDAELGFSCANLGQDKQASNTWIKLTNSLRSVLSAAYGVIVIAVSLLYLTRRNAQSQYNLKVVLPRVFAAVVISGAAPFAIGAVITLSNWLVQGIFGANPGSVTTQIYQAIYSLGAMDWNNLLSGLIGGVLGAIIPSIMLCFFAFLFVVLVVVAIVKQIALIVLILMTPIACLTFVFSSSQHFFQLWVRGLLAVVAVPVLMALVLMLGIQLSGAFYDPESMNADHVAVGLSSGNEVKRLIAAFVLAAGGMLMLKMANIAKGFATGSGKSMLRGAVNVGGKAAALGLAASGNPAAGMKVMKATSAATNAMDRAGQRTSSWIPKGGGAFRKPASSAGGGAGGGGRIEQGLDKGLAPYQAIDRQRKNQKKAAGHQGARAKFEAEDAMKRARKGEGPTAGEIMTDAKRAGIAREAQRRGMPQEDVGKLTASMAAGSTAAEALGSLGYADDAQARDLAEDLAGYEVAKPQGVLLDSDGNPHSGRLSKLGALFGSRTELTLDGKPVTVGGGAAEVASSFDSYKKVAPVAAAAGATAAVGARRMTGALRGRRGASMSGAGSESASGPRPRPTVMRDTPPKTAPDQAAKKIQHVGNPDKSRDRLTGQGVVIPQGNTSMSTLRDLAVKR